MSNEKPTGGAAVIQARCDICCYARKVRASPTDIRSVLVCKRFPPTAIAIPAPGGHAVGVASPIMQPNDMCYEFKHDPDKLKDTSGALLPAGFTPPRSEGN